MCPGLRADYVRSRLRGLVRTEPVALLRMNSTVEQEEQMKYKINLTDLGVRIHRDYRVGRMLIVDAHLHELAQRGGRSLW